MKRILLPLLPFLLVLRLAAAEPATPAAPGATNAAPRGTNAIPRRNLLITADFFEYNSSNKVAIYTGNVRVVDPPTHTNEPPTTITCKIMTVKLPLEGGKIESITADGDVVIDQGSSHATGAKAVYKAVTDFVELSGDPVLVTTNGTLRGDLVILDRRNGKLKATGRVRMELRQDTVGKSDAGLLGAKPPRPTNAVPVKLQP